MSAKAYPAGYGKRLHDARSLLLFIERDDLPAWLRYYLTSIVKELGKGGKVYFLDHRGLHDGEEYS